MWSFLPTDIGEIKTKIKEKECGRIRYSRVSQTGIDVDRAAAEENEGISAPLHRQQQRHSCSKSHSSVIPHDGDLIQTMSCPLKND